MSQTIDANLKATVTVATDFSEAQQGLDDLVQYTMDTGDLIEELLGASFSDPIERHRENMDQLIAQMNRMEEMIDPTREVQPQPQQVETREQMIQFIRESEREGTDLPVSYDPRLGGRFRSEESGQIVSTEMAREELQPHTMTPTIGTRETRGTLDMNLNVNIVGTTGGTAESMVEDIINDPAFKIKIQEYFLQFNGVIE